MTSKNESEIALMYADAADLFQRYTSSFVDKTALSGIKLIANLNYSDLI